MKKSNETFKELGFWSSHPLALQKSRKVFLIASVVPFLIFVCVLVLVCSDFESCKRALLHPGLPLKIGAVVACLCAGAVFCVCIMNLLSFTFPSSRSNEGKDRRPFRGWIPMLLFAFAWVFPWFMTRFKNSFWNGPYVGLIEFVLNLMCLLPFFWICIFLLIRSRRKGVSNSVKLPIMPLVIGMFSLVISALPFFTDLHGGIAAMFPNSRIAQSLHQSLLRLTLFGLFFPIGTMFLCLLRVGRKHRSDSDACNESDEVNNQQDDAKDVSETLKILEEFVSARGAKNVLWKEKLSLLPLEEEQLPNDCQDLAVLFNGKVPTRSQSDFLKKFRAFYDDYVSKIPTGNAAKDKSPLDVFIEGGDGSGRTESLCAAALLAVLSRGDKTLFIVKDELSAKIVKTRITKTLQNMFLSEATDSYISVKILTHGDFAEWIKHEDHVSIVPDILIAQPEVFERETFSADFTAEEHWRAIDVLLEYSTLLVDDLFACDNSVLAHLVFLLKKIRLLLSANGRFSQLVIAAPSNSADAIFKQSSFPFLHGKVEKIPFVARKDVEVWCGALQVEKDSSIDKECEELAAACAGLGLSVAIYYGENAVNHVKDFHANFPQNVILIKGFEDWECGSYPFVDVLICPMTKDDAITTALRCCVMGDASVLVYVQDKDCASVVRKPIVRMLPGNTSKALCHAHLRTLLPFMFPKLPLDMRLWNMFGVQWNDGLTDEESGKAKDVIDWAYDALSAERYSISPQLALLTNCMSRHEELDYSCFPDVMESIWQTGDGIADRMVHLGMQGDGDNAGLPSHAKWVDAEINPIGMTDLSRGDQLVCVHDGTRYYCDHVRRCPAEKCAMELAGVALPQEETEEDDVIPVRRMEWTLSNIGDVTGWTDEAYRMARFHIPADVKNVVKPLTTPISCRLTSVMNRLGHERGVASDRSGVGIEAKYSFSANISGLVLSPVPEIFSRSIKSLVEGTWGTDKRFGYSPCLTHALTAVFRSRFEGFSFYASLLAFVTARSRDRVGDVLIWIIEPEKTGMVCSGNVVSILGRDGITEEVLREALQIIIDAKDGGIEKLRILSGVAYSGEELDENDVQEACEILERLLRSREERQNDDEENRMRIEEFRKVRRERRRLTEEGTQEKEFDDLLETGLLEFKDEIDVSKFAMSTDDGGYGWEIHRITDSFEDFLWNHPEIIHVRKHWHYTCSKDKESGKISRFIFNNLKFDMTRDQYDCALQKLRTEKKRALQTIADVVDPVEKARRLHDYLIKICDYNDSARGNPSVFARSAYSVLVDHQAVCAGYVMAYRYLLDAAGIQSEEVISDKMNHCWNYVKLNGHWYHVDVTWDDLNRKNGGEDDVIYKYFLLSDKAMRERKHQEWFTRGLPEATDTWYDDYKWIANERKKVAGNGKGNKTQVITHVIKENPLEKYRNHVAFLALKQGCSLYCRGKIVLRVFFLDDNESHWAEEDRESFKTIVSSSASKILADAQRDKVSIEILASYANKKVSCAVRPNENVRTWINEVFGTTEIVDDQNHFRMAIECDESPIVFAFNKDFRSCARTTEDKQNVGRNHPEWSMVSYQKSFGEKEVVHTLVHELLHQFGAIDLYYPEKITAAGEKFLGKSIMNCGLDIDDLTRTLIGWRTDLTDNAINFLEATKDVTKEQVMEARRKEWEKRWHGG